MDLLQWVQVVDRLSEELGEPDLPLKLGAALQIQHMGLAGQVFLSYATYGEATERVREYLRLIGDMGGIEIHRAGERGELRYCWHQNADPPATLAQIFAAAVVSITPWLTMRKDIDWEFNFQFSEPIDLSPYEQTLGPRIRFRQKRTSVTFPAWVFDLPLPTQNADIRLLVEAKAAASLRSLDKPAGLESRVRKLIGEQLTAGRATSEIIARQLSLSQRTLNRRLAELNTSFREIYESVRELRASQLLLETDLSLADIGNLLGFSDQSAFQHAFKRWKSTTPSEFRNSRLGRTDR